VLRAYFDESGIHAGSKTTIICGFVGPRSEWRRVTHKWQKAMKGRVFHYKNMHDETKLLEKLATILADSRLAGINMGFLGDWDRAIKSGPAHWLKRYPSCYQTVLEMCVGHLENHSKASWDGEPIVLTFSRQDEYAKFAEKVWRSQRDRGEWDCVVGFGYGDPGLPELQTADMIAHEAFQCAREVYERGAPALHAWKNWPLVKKIVTSHKLMLGSIMSEVSLVEMLRKQDAQHNARKA
jgi:hypothetical protein